MSKFGFNAFGARHRILKAAKDFKPSVTGNLVESLSVAVASENNSLMCEHCNITMRSFNMLQNHSCCAETSSHAVETFAESTQINANKSLNFTVVDDTFEIPQIVDCVRKKRKATLKSAPMKHYRLYCK